MIHARDLRKSLHKNLHVFGAIGGYIGTVDRVEGATLLLADCPFTEDGQCAVPLEWVEMADGFVRLDRSRLEVMEECAVGPGCSELALTADAD